MRKRKILRRLLAVMVVLNLLTSAVFAAAEDAAPTESMALPAGTEPAVFAAAENAAPTESMALPAGTEPAVFAVAEKAAPSESTALPAGTEPAVFAAAEKAAPTESTALPADMALSADAPSANTEHTTHSYANGACTVCGEAHSPHAYADPNESGATCSVCGFIHEHTISVGSTCEICAYAPVAEDIQSVERSESTDSAALPASTEPSADAPADDSEHTMHSYENGVCTVCNSEHTEHTYENSVCTVCGKAHTPHEFPEPTEAGAACTVCGFSHTDHEYQDPDEAGAACAVCGYGHEHSISEEGFCEICAYTPDAKSEDVALYRSQAAPVQVDITWTAMSFTYTAGKWDPKTHTYAEGSWQAAEGGGQIALTNTGTAAAKVSFAFTSAMPGVSGRFSQSEVSVAPNESQTIPFIPTGKPEVPFTEARLGAIHITVQAAPAESGESQPERNDPT